MKSLKKKTETEVKPVPKKEEVVKVISPPKTVVKPHETESAKTETEVHVSEIKVEEKSSVIVKSIIPFVIGMVVGLLIGGGVLVYYDKGNLSAFKKNTPTPTVSVSPSPVQEKEASESADLVKDLSLFDIKILNGSGKAGEAGKLEKILKAQGFSVLDIGNADKGDYTKTLIKAKEKVSADFLKKLESYLKIFFDLDQTQKLDSKEETDIVIVVGSTTKSEASVSATPKVSPTTSQ